MKSLSVNSSRPTVKVSQTSSQHTLTWGEGRSDDNVPQPPLSTAPTGGCLGGEGAGSKAAAAAMVEEMIVVSNEKKMSAALSEQWESRGSFSSPCKGQIR